MVEGSVVFEKVQIDWQDGLPSDMGEQVAIEAQAILTELTSRESAMKRLYGLGGQALQDETQRIQDEKQSRIEMSMMASPDAPQIQFGKKKDDKKTKEDTKKKKADDVSKKTGGA